MSSKAMLRMMTLETSLTWSPAPMIFGFFPTPTRVVLEGTLMLTAAACSFAEAARASSSGPEGTVSRPQTSGS